MYDMMGGGGILGTRPGRGEKMKTQTTDIENGTQSYNNFMNLPPQYSGPGASRFVVLPVPYEATTSYRAGTAAGPQAMIEASRKVELFDVELGKRACEAGIHTKKPIAKGRRTFKNFYEAIRKEAGAALDGGRVPVVLGGEHTVTVPAVHAALERHPDVSVLQFDAHADLRSAFDGSQWSHACAMRRILSLADRPPHIAQVGIRSASSEEWNLSLRSRSVTTFLAKDVVAGRSADKKILAALGEKVYLTIDLDAFDPSEVPGVGTPEPGGLSFRRALDLISLVAEKRQIIGFDVVELCPIHGQNISDFFAAKLAYRIMGLLA